MKIKLIQNENNKNRVPNKADGKIVEITKRNKAGNFVLEYWRNDIFIKDRVFQKGDFEVIFEFKYSQHRNDLHAKAWCPICHSNGDYNMMRLSGYNDRYFFDEVNKDFREWKCRHCDTDYEYKWARNGVEMRLK